MDSCQKVSTGACPACPVKREASLTGVKCFAETSEADLTGELAPLVPYYELSAVSF